MLAVAFVPMLTLGAVLFSCREQVDEDALGPGPRRGEVLYEHHCAACHGVDGRGRALTGPEGESAVSQNLARERFQIGRSDTEILRSLTYGVPPHMPAFEPVLSKSELLDLVAHVRRIGERHAKHPPVR